MDDVMLSAPLLQATNDPVGFSTDLARDLYLFVHAVINYIYNVVNLIFQQPFLMLVFGIMILGLSISVFGYMLGRD